MNYNDAMEYINEISIKGSVLGLETIKELLDRLDNPQNKLRIIHIAGTNGKGSVLAYLEHIIEQSNRRVGRYISPTIFSYLERFQINGAYMDKEDFPKYLELARDAAKSMVRDGYNSPTAFEVETAVAFLYFLDKDVDVVLLETGMGGRLDATNVIEKPLMSIIASISMDHMAYLGDSIEKIAYEKCGIIKNNVPVVSYPNPIDSRNVIEGTAKLHKSNLYLVNPDEIDFLETNLYSQSFIYKGNEYTTKLIGEHQIYNAATAILAAKVLSKEYDFGITTDMILAGVSNTTWPGRFEIIHENPLIIRDGAHNEDAALRLRQTIEKHFTNKRIIYIIGMLKDKEYEKVLKLTAPLANKIITISTIGPRGLNAETLSNIAKLYCNDVIIADGPLEAKKMALLDADSEDVIIAFGSLSYIGEL